jgi:hypothetical protein
MQRRSSLLPLQLTPVVVAVLLLAFTAIAVQPPVDYLMSFGRLMLGVALICSALLTWAFTARFSAVVGCALGVGVLSLGAAVLSITGAGGDYSTILQGGISGAVLFVILVSLHRVASQTSS